jgi:hypothetical protein
LTNVIHIRFHEDLPTRLQNELRYRMELASWRSRWREAEAQLDYIRLDWLQMEYERIGLP